MEVRGTRQHRQADTQRPDNFFGYGPAKRPFRRQNTANATWSHALHGHLEEDSGNDEKASGADDCIARAAHSRQEVLSSVAGLGELRTWENNV